MALGYLFGTGFLALVIGPFESNRLGTFLRFGHSSSWWLFGTVLFLLTAAAVIFCVTRLLAWVIADLWVPGTRQERRDRIERIFAWGVIALIIGTILFLVGLVLAPDPIPLRVWFIAPIVTLVGALAGGLWPVRD